MTDEDRIEEIAAFIRRHEIKGYDVFTMQRMLLGKGCDPAHIDAAEIRVYGRAMGTPSSTARIVRDGRFWAGMFGIVAANYAAAGMAPALGGLQRPTVFLVPLAVVVAEAIAAYNLQHTSPKLREALFWGIVAWPFILVVCAIPCLVWPMIAIAMTARARRTTN